MKEMNRQMENEVLSMDYNKVGEESINKMKEIEKLKMMLERVCFYWYYCVKMRDEMVINQMNLVDHVKMEVVVVENNWMDWSVARKAYHY